MTDLFVALYNGSIAAGWLVLALVVLRPLLKRAPRWICVALWGLVAVRLLCPVFPESSLSLVPVDHVMDPQIMTDAAPDIQSGMVVIKEIFDPNFDRIERVQVPDGANPLQANIPYGAFGCLVWASVLGAYALVSWLLLKRRVRTAVLLRDNIFQSERVSTPFVLGLVKPRIYLPFGLEEGELRYILAHEQAHIQRKDHWWKFLGFVLMSVSLYCNPWLCVAYILLCRDIEVACDEKVIRNMAPQQRADYAQALLRCSAGKPKLGACPVAFGEVGVKARIKNVLKYKKPAVWILVLVGILCVALVVCFLTSPSGIRSAVQTEENLYSAGRLVAHLGEALYMPEDGTQKYPEIRIGTDGLQVRREGEGLYSYLSMQVQWLTREELVEQLTLPYDVWGYWNRDGDFKPEEAVPQCERVAVYSYRENETDVIPAYLVYFFDGKPGWFADIFEHTYERDKLPYEIYELQPVESSQIYPLVLYIRSGGAFAVEDYAEELPDPNFQSMRAYGKIENYRQAGNAGIQAMADRFGEDIAFEMRGCNVYYDEGDDVWYVRMHVVSLVTTLGGAHCVILSADGSVLAIWAEK